MNRNNSKAGPWRIGELPKLQSVSTDTLRHYERKRVLRSDRSSNGYREYPENAVERVRMIRQALAVGFTLDELSTIFKVFDGGGAPCQQVRTLAAQKTCRGRDSSKRSGDVAKRSASSFERLGQSFGKNCCGPTSRSSQGARCSRQCAWFINQLPLTKT